MKIPFIYILLLSFPAYAQNSFQPRNVQVTVPAWLPGVMNDASVTTKNDSLFYNFKGEVMKNNGLLIAANSRGQALSTPWQTVIELIDAYRKRDKNRIVDLYVSSSKEKVRNFINGADGNEFLDYVGQAINSGIRLISAFNYKDGVIVYTKDNKSGVHVNYLIKESGRYKLSEFEDNQGTSWNLSVYYTHEPKPMIPLKGVSVPAKLKETDSSRVNVSMPAGRNHLAVYSSNVNESVSIVVKDNSGIDLDKSVGRISFYLPGFIFPKIGSNEIYMSAFNYPVERISSTFINANGKYLITVEE